jgi:NADPH-dependent curcumin reductase CurA
LATPEKTMIPKTYRRVVLARGPPAEPAETDFRIEEVPMPEPGPGQVLVRVIYMSLDPYMRGRMRDVASYAPPVGIGEAMTGGTVGEVVKSNHPGLKVGDIVEDRLGWQEYAIGGATLRKIDPALAPISTANGVLGMPGMTAYFGLFEVGQPKAGETVVVSAASGVVGQLAKIAGCRAVGIAGGAKKCAFAKEELGLDACIDYKAGKDLSAAIEAACPNGVDVYFDNVGGAVSDAVFLNLNFFARVSLCGSISQYNAGATARPVRRPAGEHARLHRLRFCRQVSAGHAPDGRVDPLGPHQVQGGHRRGHREGAARLHRPPARRELRQAAGEARPGARQGLAGYRASVQLSENASALVLNGRPSRSRFHGFPAACTPLRVRRAPSAGISTVHTP